MTTDEMHGNLPQNVTLYPKGLGRGDLHRWKTEPMTAELMDEIIRVRTRLRGSSPETQIIRRNNRSTKV